MKPLNGEEIQTEPEKCDEKCEKCQGEMVIKVGPYGKYYECLSCKNRKRIIVTTGIKCPKCGGELVERKSRYGKVFYGCSNYPNCNTALWYKPTGEVCPDCGSLLVLKTYKKGDFIGCSNKDCKYRKEVEETEENE